MASMSSERFNVLYSGPASPTTPVKVSAKRLAEAFGIDLEQATVIIQGAPIIVKHNVDLETAQLLQQTIAAAGGVSRLEPATAAAAPGDKDRSAKAVSIPPGPHFEIVDEAPPRSASATNRTPEGEVADQSEGKLCPKCGYRRRPDDLAPDYECPRCGVVYAKFEARQERKVERMREQEAFQARVEQMQRAAPAESDPFDELPPPIDDALPSSSGFGSAGELDELPPPVDTFEAAPIERDFAAARPSPDSGVARPSVGSPSGPAEAPAGTVMGLGGAPAAAASAAMKRCPFCAEEIRVEAVKCKHCGSMLPQERAPIDPEIEALRKKGITLYTVAFVVHIVAGLMARMGYETRVISNGFFAYTIQEETWVHDFAILLAVFVVIPLTFIGAYKIVKSKARHPAWTLMGFLSIIGLVVLLKLEDRTAGAIPGSARR